jgi:hypothetical protein
MVCRSSDFQLVDGIVKIAVQPTTQRGVVLGGPTLPSAALVCQTCGNTIFLNLIVLGLLDLAGGEAAPAPEKEIGQSDTVANPQEPLR